MRLALVFVLPLALIGCAGLPRPDFSQENPGERAAAHAAKLIGTPYLYGGSTPVTGFDCSGLVQWSFRQAGVSLPHSTEAQRQGSHPVPVAELRAGDLLFFDLQEKKNSHVGIYAGDGSFVHAPSTGKDVRRDRIDSPFWRRHLSEARRLAI